MAESDWKNIQYKDGKYRTSEGGGGGSSTLSGLDDVNISSATDGQVLKYDNATSKWVNANESGGGGTVTDVEVDGVSVVNQGVAEIPAIPEDFSDLSDVQFSNLTDHQPLRYNAISQKWVNGADNYPPLIYSDEEREVGVWRDGKPLYQKSIFYDNTTADSNYCITKDVSALSIDRLVNTQFASLNINGDQIAIPYYGGSTNDFLRAWLTNNNATITIQRGRDYAKSSNAYLTIWYTKTTDTAGSGTWTTQGGYAHHYSETEHVIGTWEGKPLYEKMIKGSLANANSTRIALESTWNVKHVFGNLLETNYNQKIGIGCYVNADYYSGWVQGTSSYAITLYYSNNFKSQSYEAILQYTKTTDV